MQLHWCTSRVAVASRAHHHHHRQISHTKQERGHEEDSRRLARKQARKLAKARHRCFDETVDETDSGWDEDDFLEEQHIIWPSYFDNIHVQPRLQGIIVLELWRKTVISNDTLCNRAFSCFSAVTEEITIAQSINTTTTMAIFHGEDSLNYDPWWRQEKHWRIGKSINNRITKMWIGSL